LILFGAIKPVQAPAAVVFDEVTKDRFQNRHLIKNLEHLHNIAFPAFCAWCKYSSLSMKSNFLSSSIASKNSFQVLQDCIEWQHHKT
jgi:hypothetical protein